MRQPSDTAVGIDVGGTRVRAGRIARDGSLSGHVIEPVVADRQGFTRQVLRLIAAARDTTSAAIGIGIPGRVDPASGVIRSAGFIDLAEFDLGRRVADETGLPVRVENDATMALLAEAHARPEGAAGVILMMTVGTGIGGAILADGAPWHGGGISGQFGHVVVSADGETCNCGRVGCVETFSSGTALGRLIAEAGLASATGAEELWRAAEAGDAASRAVLERWASPFRRALETLVAVVDPGVILVGGGLGREMVRALELLPPPSGWFGLPVEAARLGDRAGVVGAGLAALARAGSTA